MQVITAAEVMDKNFRKQLEQDDKFKEFIKLPWKEFIPAVLVFCEMYNVPVKDSIIHLAFDVIHEGTKQEVAIAVEKERARLTDLLGN